jgi:hypothetical protein
MGTMKTTNVVRAVKSTKRTEPTLNRKASRLERLIWSRGHTILSLSKSTGLGLATVWGAVRSGRMSPKTLEKLAIALQVNEDELLAGQD